METEFFAVAHHGTAGLGNSFGYACVVHKDDVPRHDQTTTVWGPYTREHAEREAERMEALCYKFVLKQDLLEYNNELAETNAIIEILNSRIIHMRNMFPDDDPSDLLAQLAADVATVEYINSRIEIIQEKIRAIAA